MTDPVYIPGRRTHRAAQMVNLPHPSNAHRLSVFNNNLTQGDIHIAALGALKIEANSAAETVLLELLADCLTHGYRCATEDMRRVLNYGEK